MHVIVLSLLGCSPGSDAPADWGSWYDPGKTLDVEERVEFTDVPYDFVGTDPIDTLPAPGAFETWFTPQDAPPENCEGWRSDPSLPREITGIATVHPRMYIKVSGCLPPDDFSVDSDEKYYGSYYIQDRSGGFFVLGDSRVAHFEMGDRVTLRVRAIKEYFGSLMISAHDVVEVQRGPEPIFFREVEGRVLSSSDQAEVVRIEGTVAAEMGDFGEIYLCTGDSPDTSLVSDQARNGDLVPACARSNVTDPPWFKVGLDVELQRRGHSVAPGERIQVTGPVHLSFGDYQVTVMKLGQMTRLD